MYFWVFWINAFVFLFRFGWLLLAGGPPCLCLNISQADTFFKMLRACIDGQPKQWSALFDSEVFSRKPDYPQDTRGLLEVLYIILVSSNVYQRRILIPQFFKAALKFQPACSLSTEFVELDVWQRPPCQLFPLCLSSAAWVLSTGYKVAHPRTWHIVGGDFTISVFLSALSRCPSKAL